MEEVRRKMEEVRQRHKRLHPHSQSNTEPASSKDPSRYLIAIGGVAAGLTIASLFWLASTTLADHMSFTAADTADVIQPGEFRKSTEAIAQLNKRVEVLGDTVGMLETRLARLMDTTVAVSDGNEKHNPPPAQALLESDEPGPASDFNKVRVSREIHGRSEAKEPFVATHTVNAKLNFRSAASLKSKPIAILKAGTEVQFLRELDRWDYVSTQSHGEGWVSSKYLSPILPSGQRTSAN